MEEVTKIEGTRSELLAKLYEMLATESGKSACKMFFIKQAKKEKSTCKDEKVIVGVFRKVS